MKQNASLVCLENYHDIEIPFLSRLVLCYNYSYFITVAFFVIHGIACLRGAQLLTSCRARMSYCMLACGNGVVDWGEDMEEGVLNEMITLSLMNRLVKYADDTTLVVPQRTDCPIEVELQNIVDWSLLNKLTINKSKTKEIIFWKSGKVSKNLNIPTIPQIERVQQVRLLGVILSSNLSFTPHIDYVLAVASQRFYLLNQLKKCLLQLQVLTVYSVL